MFNFIKKNATKVSRKTIRRNSSALQKVGSYFGFTIIQYDESSWVNHTQGGTFDRKVTPIQNQILHAAKELDESVEHYFKTLTSSSQKIDFDDLNELTDYVKKTRALLVLAAKNSKNKRLTANDCAYSEELISLSRYSIDKLSKITTHR
mgnify:CR=1 FL=1